MSGAGGENAAARARLGALPTVRVESLAQFVDELAKFTSTHQSELWFRGHARCEWPLVPAVHRGGKNSRLEQALAIRFKRAAPARHRHCPAGHELGAWLQLMQHYRLPTRLLDWSQSALTALFFAVAEDLTYDGSVWALDPFDFNLRTTGTAAMGFTSSGHAKMLADDAFGAASGVLAPAVALLGDEVDLRMVVQLAAFTVHKTDLPLQQLPEAAGLLTEFRIAAHAKREMYKLLQVLGVRRASLFPDLENLARDLAESRWE